MTSAPVVSTPGRSANLGAPEGSAGGLVAGPEPSKLMARVRIPAGAFPWLAMLVSAAEQARGGANTRREPRNRTGIRGRRVPARAAERSEASRTASARFRSGRRPPGSRTPPDGSPTPPGRIPAGAIRCRTATSHAVFLAERCSQERKSVEYPTVLGVVRSMGDGVEWGCAALGDAGIPVSAGRYLLARSTPGGRGATSPKNGPKLRRSSCFVIFANDIRLRL